MSAVTSWFVQPVYKTNHHTEWLEEVNIWQFWTKNDFTLVLRFKSMIHAWSISNLELFKLYNENNPASICLIIWLYPNIVQW